METKESRFNWHRVTFWGLIGVAGVFLAASTLREDRRVITVFEQQGRDELRKFVGYNFPSLADKWGYNEIHTVPSSR